MLDKYLFSIEVEPYQPNRQMSIITTNGGEPRLHFPTKGQNGVLVAMISFDDVNSLERTYDWIKDAHKGYYRIREGFKA